MMKIGRETTDLDFLLTRMKAEEKEVQQILEEIISIPSEDGFAFSFDGIELLAQPHMDYPGYRVTLKTTFVCIILEVTGGKYWKIEHGKILRVVNDEEHQN